MTSAPGGHADPQVGVIGALTGRGGDAEYRIDGVDRMAPFLMTVVSESDLWMFVSSTGAVTAGRVDADHAIFPYETDDRLHRAAGVAGPVTLIARTVAGERELWQPFAPRSTPGCRRSIVKGVLGNRIVFEESRPSWGLTFRAAWAPSDAYGWVRTVELRADEEARGHVGSVDYEVLDGLLDVMPAGVDALTEQIRSNLVDAYKRAETGPWGSLAVYSLESMISDRAEPLESLTATVVWSSGFPVGDVLLDAGGVADMIDGRPAVASALVTGQAGAYLLRGEVSLTPGASETWSIVADTGLDHADVADATEVATSEGALDRVAADAARGSERLRTLLEGADAFQQTGEPVADAHHLSNVLFNCMRGGVFPFGNAIPIADLRGFVERRHRGVLGRHVDWFDRLGEWSDEDRVRDAALATDDPDLIRLVLEYLPLTFSRRHGDPSRPWNRFSISVRDENGEPELAYEGNWRDIFQNWEALLQSYPTFSVNVVAKFVNATTIDGYNPYRISQDGIDWEVPDPDDPWSHIGYWGDHQIVYLMRLLELWERYEPGARRAWLDRDVFVHADVPYLLARHDAIVEDPRNTISYDVERASAIAEREDRIGADGRLLVDDEGALVRVGLFEKLLVPALGKLTNFVPDGGIWLNTQRPEWNDANNALAGPGLSMVTLFYLRRYLKLLMSIADSSPTATLSVTDSVAEWIVDLGEVFVEWPTGPIDDRSRRTILDRLGRSGEAHRRRARSGRVGVRVDVAVADIIDLCSAATACLDSSIRSARRGDGLYHSYNRVSFPSDDAAGVDHLGPMLEGQVAVLSSGVLDTEQALAVVDALFESRMYRRDQDTFLLYPPAELLPFTQRNRIDDDAAQRIGQLSPTVVDAVVNTDRAGNLRFRPAIVNAKALAEVLDATGASDEERAVLLAVHEAVFDHRSFTGRSGRMHGYEGIGSVYWHMVAKLLVAVQELYWDAVDRGDPEPVIERVAEAYRRIRAGLGYYKSPTEFGAIPTDCYSHTPTHAGAQQPGMTGQVKEEILARLGELGLRVDGGRLRLALGLLASHEVFAHDGEATPGRARLTVCGVPVTIEVGDADAVVIDYAGGSTQRVDGAVVPTDVSSEIFGRTGSVAGLNLVARPTAPQPRAE